MTATLLTSDEQLHWNEFGYLHIRNALGPDEVSAILAAITDLHQRVTGQPRSPQPCDDAAAWDDVFDAGNERDLSIANAIAHVEALGPLLDHYAVFGRILGLMGPYVQVLGSEIFIRYPHQQPLVDFHTDLGPSLRLAAPSHGKQIQLKVQFFLTDLTEPDSGNFTIAPGSHTRGFPGKIAYADVEDPVQILARAGDAVIFPLSLGHGVAPNRSATSRVSVVLRYGQIFCRTVDYRTASPGLLDRLTQRQCRLLGDFGVRSRPGDVYGAVPDQLDLIYGSEWAGIEEAQRDIRKARIDQLAYETL
ncbi:phytanoyl-CoA dioxygenase family protein [Nocardia miyunensis]|uniref:phytanoyl-CoA dioxygenase family protein n=1 Tax=Nocardia miyunensis TaxID=282684 RepID=UPI000831EA32|nr:phytanoyl-CoA dioxygenase family protein [Nocardia miyunensis]